LPQFETRPVTASETPAEALPDPAAGPEAPQPTGPVNRRLLLAERPVGKPGLQHFRIERLPIPEPGPGEILLKTEYLSLDPYMRGRMNANAGYAAPVAIGGLMVGQTLSKVTASQHPDFAVGDRVVADAGWQDWLLSDGRGLRKLDPAMPQPTLALSALGMPGLTAYVGLLDIGQPKPGDTVVVAAATGPVGSAVGQIARLKGCRVVGIAGGEDKCRMAVEQFGFDACVSHHDDELPRLLAEACPDGIDIYFENTGGAAFEAALPLFNDYARMPLCGQVAWANATSLPAGYDLTPRVMRVFLHRRVRLQGFIVTDHLDSRFDAFLADMSAWVAEGHVKVVEDVVDGLEHAPGALSGLLSGYNLGKLLVRVEDVLPDAVLPPD